MSNWPLVRLSDVAAIERDSVQATAIEDGTLYVGLENIVTGGDFFDVREVAQGELASSKFHFTSAHLLYGKLRPYLAKIARPTFSGICSTDILPVLPSAKLSRDYLSHYLRQQEMVDLANASCVRCQSAAVEPQSAAAFELPLPPLAEQRRIAAMLDQAETLRAQRRAAIAQLDSLGQAIFRDFFGDPATNSRGLPLAALGDLGDWKSGGTPSRSATRYFDGAVPWFSSGELDSMYVNCSNEHVSEAALRETSAKGVPAGALMLGMYDTAALKSSIAGVDCSCNQAIAFASIDPKLAHGVYVYFAIVIGREHFRRLQRGVRQKNLNLSMIRELRIPLAPLARQQAFVERVATIEKLKFVQGAALARLDELFASLQHRAFRGEL